MQGFRSVLFGTTFTSVSKKKSKSCAPEDAQKFARNMLS
jgi:hypothetical protein